MTSSQSSPSRPINLARNRENQRASRARRKGYVEQLESRLRKYEREGAAATVEVQSAARQVAEENFWLRSLLATYGVSTTDMKVYVDERRRGSLNTSIVPVSKGRAAPANSTHQPSQAVKQTLATSVETCSVSIARERCNAQRSGNELNPAKRLDSSWSTSQAAPADYEVEGATDSVPYSSHDSTPGTSETTGSNQSFSYSKPTSHSKHVCHDKGQIDISTGDVTSCESAARIIASMRGHEDLESVWPELGCIPAEKCSVKNVTIFQIADR